VGVVTINMPRLAYQSENEADFYARLDHLMDLAARSLKTKRTVITKFLEAGLYPYTKRYLGTFDNHFSTIGLVGMNEACLNAKWLREDLTQVGAQQFTKDVLNHMRERLSDYQEKYGDLYNLEATPAESTTYRFAKHDKEAFPDIITANDNGTPYYTNSSHLPVGFTEDIFSALDVQEELQTLYTSGTVFHAFLGEKLPDWKAAATLVRKIAENYKLPYYTISPTYSVCKNHGYIAGEVYECPCCHEKTEVYSRITGYYRPVQNWNDGKSQEFKDRKVYDVEASKLAKSSAAMASLVEQTARAASAVPTNRGAQTGDVATEATQGVGQEATKQEPTESKAAEQMAAPAIQETEIPLVEAALKPGLYLVATHTCPNCHFAAAQLDKAGIQYETLFAEENQELIKQFNLMQAPSLIKVSSAGDAETFGGAAAVFKEISELMAVAR
ncbi:MAG: anaerobic ribonucleoside-triphosphate reductase, partial [Eggerthellaceae bacterium]|nr:anaerobic ribonucleoside-triphosphate reductase [Eggerthellaceae bacterium]